ncbi:MAG TPA: alpha/beta fold hydrolase [Thermoanaerobaculia bacterium]|nr:alpha/beta fold hydrolase [Thermoanaerobaculia bacterium]
MHFSPAWWLRNPHAQTVWGRLTRSRRLVPLRREIVSTPDGDELALDHLDAPDPPVHLVLMHGLEGSSRSVYIQGILGMIAKRGWSATAINFRSCASEPEHPNLRPRFYHSGETSDFDFVVRSLRVSCPIVAFGASLGGNVLLKWLGEHPGESLVAAAATISVPYDLGAGAKYLDDNPIGRLYVGSFLRSLKKKVRRVVEQHHTPLDLERAMNAKTFREFDDAATAPLHGFTDANDYYTRSSSIHFLPHITVPTLCVSAADDPFLPPGVLDRARAVASPSVTFIVTERGGHVGFIAGGMPGRAVYWAEERIVEWLGSDSRQRTADSGR